MMAGQGYYTPEQVASFMAAQQPPEPIVSQQAMQTFSQPPQQASSDGLLPFSDPTGKYQQSSPQQQSSDGLLPFTGTNPTRSLGGQYSNGINTPSYNVDPSYYNQPPISQSVGTPGGPPGSSILPGGDPSQYGSGYNIPPGASMVPSEFPGGWMPAQTSDASGGGTFNGGGNSTPDIIANNSNPQFTPYDPQTLQYLNDRGVQAYGPLNPYDDSYGGDTG